MSLNIDLFGLKSVELNCHSFMISLDKCNGRYNVVDDSSTKICGLSKTKNINLFNMMTRISDCK